MDEVDRVTQRIKLFLPNYLKYSSDDDIVERVSMVPVVQGSLMTDVGRLNRCFEYSTNMHDENRNLKQEIQSLKGKIDEMIK